MACMNQQVLIAGAGIGGLAAAIASARAGWDASVFEQAAAFSEAGAGIQLAPNVTRILAEWGLLQGDLLRQAWRPLALRVRDGLDGRELARLDLSDFEARYGGPHLTVHRADLQAALLAAAREAGARLHVQRKVVGLTQTGQCVRVRTDAGPEAQGEALVAADGLWSVVREAVGLAEPPLPYGHLAYRGLAPGPGTGEVSVWLAPAMHLVSYPVRGGASLNVVCLVEGRTEGDPRAWDHAAVAASLETAVGALCGGARETLQAVADWRLWALHDRPPLHSADGMARGRVALLGDAAHPMLPYLAQGAGMAIEDARALQQVLAVTGDGTGDVPMALRRYALDRWERVARVQQRSRRNATIFHAAGPVRLGRNLAMRALGPRLLDQPWLFGGP